MADEDQPVELTLEPEQPELDLKQPAEPAKKPPEKPAGVSVLQKQLQELEQRAESDRKQREETEKVARQREEELARYRQVHDQQQTEIVDGRYQSIVNTIDAFKRDSELAKRDYATALANGDFNQVADAQTRLARAEAQIVTLENGKAQLEQQIETWKGQQQQQPQQRVLTPSERFDAYIGQFTPRAQQYLRQHPEFATDDKLNRRLLRAHGEAVDEQGIVPDTDAYYRFLDDRMAPAVQAPERQRPSSYRGPPAAPVSRQPMNGSHSGTTVTLSPAEREAARIAGVTEVEYARQMLTAEAAGEITRH